MRRAEDWKVAAWLPTGEQGSAAIDRFTVDDREAEYEALRAALNPGRMTLPVPAGTYSRLAIDGCLMMTDTPSEVRDHTWPVIEAERRGAVRVLLNGLGLGMVAAQLLAVPSVRHVDIVESNADVIDLVAPHLARLRPGTIDVHRGDAFTMEWRRGLTWDVAWHDVWESICLYNRDGMIRLTRRFQNRVEWQGCWSRPQVERVRQQRVSF
jgi:hypothetical protein